MKRIFILLTVAFFACKAYQPHHPKINKGQLPDGCGELYDFVGDNFVRHKELACHQYFDKMIRLTSKPNKECIKKLDKTQLVQLFGQPDEITNENGYNYYFKRDCENPKEHETYFFQVIFDADTVRLVDSGSMDYKEIKKRK